MSQTLKEWVQDIKTPEILKKDEGKIKNIKDILLEDMTRIYFQYQKGLLTKEEYDRYGNYAKYLIEKSNLNIEQIKGKYFEQRTNTLLKARKGTSLLFKEVFENKENSEQLQKNKFNVALDIIDLYIEFISGKNGDKSNISINQKNNFDINILTSLKKTLSTTKTGNIDSKIENIKKSILEIETRQKIIGKGKIEVIFRDLINSKVDNPDYSLAEVLKFFRQKDHGLVSSFIEKRVSESKFFQPEMKKLEEFKDKIDPKLLELLSKEFTRDIKDIYMVNSKNRIQSENNTKINIYSAEKKLKITKNKLSDYILSNLKTGDHNIDSKISKLIKKDVDMLFSNIDSIIRIIDSEISTKTKDMLVKSLFEEKVTKEYLKKLFSNELNGFNNIEIDRKVDEIIGMINKNNPNGDKHYFPGDKDITLMIRNFSTKIAIDNISNTLPKALEKYCTIIYKKNLLTSKIINDPKLENNEIIKMYSQINGLGNHLSDSTLNTVNNLLIGLVLSQALGVLEVGLIAKTAINSTTKVKYLPSVISGLKNGKQLTSEQQIIMGLISDNYLDGFKTKLK